MEEQKEYQAKIYTLSGPDGRVFYVGCTIQDIELRLAGHINEAKGSAYVLSYYKQYKTPIKDAHIISLQYDITATIIDMLTVTGINYKEVSKQTRELERKWISYYVSQGFFMVNVINRNEPKKQKPQFVGKTVKAA